MATKKTTAKKAPAKKTAAKKTAAPAKTSAAKTSTVDKQKEQIKELKAQIKGLEKKLAKIKALTQ